MALESAYQPLATSPSNESNLDEQKGRHRRSRIDIPFTSFILSRRKLVLAILLSLSLISAALFSLPALKTLYGSPIELVPAENPYFQTGGIWDHNDAIAAKLYRCEALGLLRNTSLPLESNLRPSAEEEAALTAEGCGTNETTIIILASLWFAEAYSGTSNTGESIYAQSVISALNANNYSYVFTSLGWYNPDMKKTVELWNQHRWNVRMILADPDQVNVCWNPEHNCVKSEANPEGIEAWRLMSFWYWDTIGNPLGPTFTLSPFAKTPNTLMSLSIEPTCKRLPYLPSAYRPHPPQAWLLAKQVHYLDNTTAFSWTLEALTGLQKEFGIHVKGGMVDDDAETLKRVKAANIENVGRLGKIEFYEELAKSSVLIGVGRPRISPSPWDALCVGVPFINPILEWDEEDPKDRSKWHAQQWHMTDLDPPYVYNVHAHDIVGLRRAVHAAIHHPIESFIPEVMTFKWVRNRMGEIVESDWRTKAKGILEERLRVGEGALFVM
ncbi:hypothetical protein TREMEDRAFT_42765 [Tremella mesenterica DSM 1558]|uniref:uncharacterized protein n=1 Tax=Tremella mesenterica (strain ATCC 24925 / CBS 8224 / DSM 1558 / NBRC 9311 / NRRL Y-6157 / RJB 2259-6 / UBC 559-6) TaxID=578456 RepID=UPI0003F4A59C|nr:uncharacterized protein TREMEDRAFT_42765 [Tremella mesenterica DSM 1558]EIW71341.1 hypothetical protein TREMEDRAFT_42765 [Tremella mesenterica DSM 1558]